MCAAYVEDARIRPSDRSEKKNSGLKWRRMLISQFYDLKLFPFPPQPFGYTRFAAFDTRRQIARKRRVLGKECNANCRAIQFFKSTHGKRWKLTKSNVRRTRAARARRRFARGGCPRVDTSAEPWCWCERLMYGECELQACRRVALAPGCKGVECGITFTKADRIHRNWKPHDISGTAHRREITANLVPVTANRDLLRRADACQSRRVTRNRAFVRDVKRNAVFRLNSLRQSNDCFCEPARMVN